MIAISKVVSAALLGALGLASTGVAFSQGQAIERRGGSCPSGYNQSGNYCVPSSSSAGQALPRVGGSCPSGFNQSGDYCVGSSLAKHAMVRSGGSCPSGYAQSGSYCVKQ